MKIEIGKIYRTRDGRKAHVFNKNTLGYPYPMEVLVSESECLHFYDEMGNYVAGESSKWDLVAEWVDEPKTWGEMTPEEKGALLLAAHEHRPMEFLGRYESTGKWLSMGRGDTYFVDDYCYRVKPEPEVDQVTLYGGGAKGMVWCEDRRGSDLDTHKITFSLVDGEPDCGSIKMEKIRSNEE